MTTPSDPCSTCSTQAPGWQEILAYLAVFQRHEPILRLDEMHGDAEDRENVRELDADGAGADNRDALR